LCFSFNKIVIKKCWRFLFSKKKNSEPNHSKSKAEADLLSICVIKRYRGQGISVELIKEFEKRVVAAGKKDLTLAVYQDNERAISFYKKMGYDIVCENSDEYKMYKKLN